MCGSIYRSIDILLLLNTDVKGTRSQIERLGATDGVARLVILLTLLTHPIFFGPAKLIGFDGNSPTPPANRVATPVTLQALQTLRTLTPAWFSVAIDRKQGGRSPRSDR